MEKEGTSHVLISNSLHNQGFKYFYNNNNNSNNNNNNNNKNKHSF